jgi:hypothetical protein
MRASPQIRGQQERLMHKLDDGPSHYLASAHDRDVFEI